MHWRRAVDHADSQTSATRDTLNEINHNIAAVNVEIELLGPRKVGEAGEDVVKTARALAEFVNDRAMCSAARAEAGDDISKVPEALAFRDALNNFVEIARKALL